MKIKLTIGLLVYLCILTACSAASERAELEEDIQQIGEALPEEYKKYKQTDVYDTIYQDDKGNTMVYYICHTTFYAADPNDVTGLHMDAISAVFDIQHTELLQELEISGHPAAIYQLAERHVICCTIRPEDSVVLDYDPKSVSDHEATLVIRSIFEGPDVAKESKS